MLLSTPYVDHAPAAEETLLRCRELVRPALRTAVDRLHPWPRRVVSYSFGWVAADGSERAAPGSGGGTGQGVRPALAVLAAEAVGGACGSAVPGAVAVELVHASTLVHDDVADRGEQRRGRPAAWKEFGTGPAVLSGDALLALAVDVVSRVGGERSAQAVRLVSGALAGLVHGRSEEALFGSRPWAGPDAVRPAEYREAALRRTGTLLGCAAALGALLAGGSAGSVEAFGTAGRRLGLALQLAREVTGIWGPPTAGRRPDHGSLLRGARTMPVVAAAALDQVVAGRLEKLLGGGEPLTRARAAYAAQLVEEAGGREFAVREARRALESARDALDGLALAGPAAEEIDALAEFVVERRLRDCEDAGAVRMRVL